MKKLLLFSFMLILLAGCSTKKQIVQQLHRGNYDQAVSSALIQLQSKKSNKRKSKFIGILKEGYDRITKRDLEDIAFLKKDNNPQNYVRIFEMYSTLDARQRAIEPLLPLYLDGREVIFEFNDYTSDMIDAKNKASQILYNNALNLLKSNNKFDIRRAYDDLAYLNDINPNYNNIQSLMQEAHFKGIDYVVVSILNDTQQIIPERLEEDLLDFDTYGLDNFWTIYHGNQSDDIDYDYAMQLQLKNIQVSPEQINRNQVIRKKKIVDGWKYQLDENGNVVKDSLGNDIKIDKIITVRAILFETQQTKAANIVGKVSYTDLQTNQLLQTFPINSEFIFENWFGSYRGDKRALTNKDLDLINNIRVPFPTNEQMVFDTGEGLKFKLKDIINSYNIGG